MILGLTGCPGSGKSILSSELVRNGWTLVDADDIGHEVIENDADVLGELIHAFGDDIVDEDGVLQRRELGKRAFSNPEMTGKLNDIVHPPLIGLLKKKIGDLQSSGENVVVDCALIFEWDIGDIFDRVVCVAAEEHIRKERIMRRDGRSAEDVEHIFSSQMPEIEKVKRADIVVKNNDSIEDMIIFGKLLARLPEYRREV